eukprot:CAMPEP_0169255706 /NCGR_PEP_ID=MMETSP1016-20121227/39890_1 /TAXON_ID=342587 /ORGANISM="Karlodinium micrum, Strain CCMP2283" /LENGTH=41 /DNA_ID= /DNA_START= /DNA_END= /DNA_ORIENTATION=
MTSKVFASSEEHAEGKQLFLSMPSDEKWSDKAVLIQNYFRL